MRLELVFAGLETLARLEHEHTADEHPWLIDHAFAVEHIGDIAHAGAMRNVDDAILRQRTRRLETLITDEEHDAGQNRQQHENADDGVADDDERMPRARRAAGRHFDRVGFDRRSRAPRHDALRIRCDLVGSAVTTLAPHPDGLSARILRFGAQMSATRRAPPRRGRAKLRRIDRGRGTALLLGEACRQAAWRTVAAAGFDGVRRNRGDASQRAAWTRSVCPQRRPRGSAVTVGAALSPPPGGVLEPVTAALSASANRIMDFARMFLPNGNERPDVLPLHSWLRHRRDLQWIAGECGANMAKGCWRALRRHPAEHEGRIGAAKSERIRQHDIDRPLARLVRHEIDRRCDRADCRD